MVGPVWRALDGAGTWSHSSKVDWRADDGGEEPPGLSGTRDDGDSGRGTAMDSLLQTPVTTTIKLHVNRKGAEARDDAETTQHH